MWSPAASLLGDLTEVTAPLWSRLVHTGGFTRPLARQRGLVGLNSLRWVPRRYEVGSSF